MSTSQLVLERVGARNGSGKVTVTFVIPALNEERAVGTTIARVRSDELARLGFASEILVVDNDSEDNTAIEAQEAGARVVHEERRGYGSAFLRGLREAQGDILVLCDADGTYPIEYAHLLVRPIAEGRADLVIGSRFRGGIADGAMPWHHRYIGNPLLTFVQNRLFGTRLSDAHCGFRAISKNAFLALGLECTGMEFACEMLVKAAVNQLRVEEVPITYRRRAAGKPKLRSFRDGWRHLKFLFATFFRLRVVPFLRREARPRYSASISLLPKKEGQQ